MYSCLASLLLWFMDVICYSLERINKFVFNFIGLTLISSDALWKMRDTTRSCLLSFSFVPSGKVIIVGAGPGRSDLITVRGLKALKEATCIVADRLVDPQQQKEFSWRIKFINVGKSPSKKRFPQSKINEILISEARKGHVVVRLKGGDPFVFGLGGEEASMLKLASIPYEIVPGVSSAIAVPAFAGIPVTQKGLATSFSVVSGHAKPGAEGAPDWLSLCSARDNTLVVLMGTSNLSAIVTYILDQELRLSSTPAVVIQSGTSSQQLVIQSTLQNIVKLAQHVKPPTVLVIGQVAALHDSLNWFVPSSNINVPVWGEARADSEE